MGHSGGMVGTLDAGMSTSSGRPRECSNSMEGRLEVVSWEGWLSGGSCDLDVVSVSPSSFWSVGPPSPSSPLPSLSSPVTYEIRDLGLEVKTHPHLTHTLLPQLSLLVLTRGEELTTYNDVQVECQAS